MEGKLGDRNKLTVKLKKDGKKIETRMIRISQRTWWNNTSKKKLKKLFSISYPTFFCEIIQIDNFLIKLLMASAINGFSVEIVIDYSKLLLHQLYQLVVTRRWLVFQTVDLNEFHENFVLKEKPWIFLLMLTTFPRCN